MSIELNNELDNELKQINQKPLQICLKKCVLVTGVKLTEVSMIFY